MAKNNTNAIVAILAIAAIVILAFVFIGTKDNRTGAEKIGDAISELPNGPSEAAEQLEDRSPAEKAADAVSDKADEIENDIKNN